MPRRTIPLIVGEYYHIFNRGVEKRLTFTERRNYFRFMETVRYYRFSDQSIKLSGYLRIPLLERLKGEKKMSQSLKQLVSIISYVLMPNHFHFLVRQEMDDGVSDFIRNLTNSYTKYFNTKYDRVGPLFQGPFKCVLIEDDDQLLHVSRYIHLNPYTSLVIRSLEELTTLPWNSFSEYVSGKSSLCDQQIILSLLSKDSYKKFVLNHGDYQKKLEYIKHLLLE